MTQPEFDMLYDTIKIRTEIVVAAKGKEYGRDDRLHNFRAMASLQSAIYSIIEHKGDDFDAWIGVWLKHFVSILDIITDLRSMEVDPDVEVEEYYANMAKLINEKSGDNIIYQILLEALLRDRL